MFLVLLRFAANRAEAAAHMEGHKAWLERGFEDGVFVMAGSLQPGQGGALVALGATREELDARLNDDPFVAAGVVGTEVLEIAPSRTDDRLSFLLG